MATGSLDLAASGAALDAPARNKKCGELTSWLIEIGEEGAEKAEATTSEYSGPGIHKQPGQTEEAADLALEITPGGTFL